MYTLDSLPPLPPSADLRPPPHRWPLSAVSQVSFQHCFCMPRQIRMCILSLDFSDTKCELSNMPSHHSIFPLDHGFPLYGWTIFINQSLIGGCGLFPVICYYKQWSSEQLCKQLPSHMPASISVRWLPQRGNFWVRETMHLKFWWILLSCHRAQTLRPWPTSKGVEGPFLPQTHWQKGSSDHQSFASWWGKTTGGCHLHGRWSYYK